MKTKVITLEHVPVTYRVPMKKIIAEFKLGLEVICGAGCLFFGVFILAMILYAYGG